MVERLHPEVGDRVLAVETDCGIRLRGVVQGVGLQGVRVLELPVQEVRVPELPGRPARAGWAHADHQLRLCHINPDEHYASIAGSSSSPGCARLSTTHVRRLTDSRRSHGRRAGTASQWSEAAQGPSHSSVGVPRESAASADRKRIRGQPTKRGVDSGGYRRTYGVRVLERDDSGTSHDDTHDRCE